MASKSTRQDDLKTLRGDLQTRMAECSSDQNFAVMGRLLVDVLKQIEDASPAGNNTRGESVLSEFEAKLRARQAGAPAPRSAVR